MSIYKIRPISFKTATEKQLEAWYDLRIEFIREIHPDDPDMSLDYMLRLNSLEIMESQGQEFTSGSLS